MILANLRKNLIKLLQKSLKKNKNIVTVYLLLIRERGSESCSKKGCSALVVKKLKYICNRVQFLVKLWASDW